MSNFLRINRWLIVLCCVCWNINISAAEPVQQSQDDADSTQQSPLPITPNFHINLQNLSKNNSANEHFWINVQEQKVLVLKYWARGRVSRGNAIILHAEGEHADHPRVTAKLSKQLSELGWQIFVPTLPNADYPISSTEKKQTDEDLEPKPGQTAAQSSPQQNQQSSPKINLEKDKNNNFFNSDSSYQEFINALLDQLMQEIQPQLPNLVLIANQNSGYWSLPTTNKAGSLTHVVFIEPLLPKHMPNDLEKRFNQQTLPVFTFVEEEQSFSAFITAFEKQLWRSPSLRINRGKFSNQGIELEDIQIAKSISGWIQSQQKQK